MVPAIEDLGGGHSPSEFDASSGAFVNDTAPSLGGNGAPAHSVPGGPPAEVRSPQTLATRRQRSLKGVVAAAVGVTLLAFGWLLMKGSAEGRRRKARRSWFGAKRRRR